MSETAETIIKSAMRAIGALAPGETPTSDELTDGLEALKFMLRSWGSQNLYIHFTTQENFPLTGATYYTIGTGGTFNTTRPTFIRGAYLDDKDSRYDILTEAQYRNNEYGLWYSPEYPLGKIYIYPLDTGTLYLDTLKPFTELTGYTDSLTYPPEYDEAIKFNLALRLCPEYGRPATQELIYFAKESMNYIVTRNFAEKVNMIKPEILKVSGYNYDIDADI